MSVNASYRFLSYVRAGMSGLVSAVDTLGRGAPIPAIASVDINVPVTGADYQDETQPKPDTIATNHVSLHGPGDISGINSRQVIRTFPRDRATSAETTMFPLIEFDRPDFPWMFTPAQATADGRLRPWLCLVVVARKDGVTFGPLPGKPLPVLSIESPASVGAELPDPADAWLWAHAQIIGQSGGDVGDVLEHPSALTLSRLIAPRNLQPDTAYLACVVPTFDVGRKAGLGETVTPADETALMPAWTPAATSVTLPVYHHFEFSTSVAGDFESLAELLVPRDAPITLGHQPMDVTHPGSGMPDIVPVDLKTDGAIFELQGALRSREYVPEAWPESAHKPYADRLTVDLNAVHQRSQPAAGAPAGELTVGPPLYGQWHAAASEIDGTEPLWMRDLNLDPGNRVAASFAAAVVDLDGEDLMASAWNQIGVVNEANRALRAAQLGREISQRLYDRHVLPLVRFDALHATSAVHARVLADGVRTVEAAIAQSALPLPAASTTMRRVLRTQGPLARSWRLESTTTASVTARLATGNILASPNVLTPDGAVTLSAPVPVLGEELASQVANKLGTAVAGSAGLTQHIAEHNTVLATAPTMLESANAVRTARPSAFEFGQVATEFTRHDRFAASTTAVRAVETQRLDGNVSAQSTSGSVLEHVRAGAAELGSAVRAFESTPLGTVLFGRRPPSLSGTVSGPATAPMRPVSIPTVRLDSADALAVRDVAASFAARIVVSSDAPARALAPALPVDSIRATMAAALAPAQTILSRLNYRLNIDLTARSWFGDVAVRDPLAGIMAAPVFTRPMYEALRDHYQEFLVPGLEEIPPNTITLVATNPTFVEAFMVGLNHEMARKLLWREYPTDQRGTYFKRFWGDTDDIPAIPAFDAGALGTHVLGGSQPQLVLLVRGELLRRYPSAIVYAILATGGQDKPVFDDSRIIMPIFRGSLKPDFTFIGFPIIEQQARTGIPNADPAKKEDYWFVIAEHPTEPRFGLHNPEWNTLLAAPASPDDVTWAHVARTPLELSALAYAPTSAPFPPLQGAHLGPAPLNVQYGQDAAAQAHITYRNPVRVVMHANDVLGTIPNA